ncbi:hypothetical protein CKO44_14340 [Rubrivivax gelatinosus]|uniref:Ig-like domain-containing protein n=1 Tax=Rubrivivax gelatinosus TaxID=28068 RepID=UPI001907991A|nr:Ig-like domain-containing protein [Rubrivivax gelatinosus]MBK1614649.1 hypothetical protein [Rubrivivax gelatinosus]
MAMLKKLFALVALLALASCGGGSSNPKAPDDGGGTGTASASDLVLSLSSATISNDGSGSVTAVATALDAKRNVVADVPVVIAVDQNATVQVTGAATADDGTVTGTVRIGSDTSNRVITVTAISGSITRTASLAVVDTPTTTTPKAADLNLVLSSSKLDNGGTNTITATVTAIDSRRNTVASVPVTFTVDGNAVITPAGTTTGTNGVLTATVGIGADRSSRAVTVTATSGTITKSASFSVSGAKLTASLSPLVDAGSTGNNIEYQLLDNAGAAMVGATITVTSTVLGTTTGTTNSQGKYVYTYQAPSSATTLVLVASAAGESITESITVQAAGSGSVPVATEVPTSASLTPTPSVVSVNSAGSTANQVELRALFLGASNQPVKNIRVRFDLADNANSSDGVTSWLGGNYAYSDSTGVARGTFTPGLRSSPTNGITVRACWDTTDFDTSTCPHSATSTLTVTSEALSVNIRTNELIQEGTAKLTYIKQFVVMVVDAAGQAKADVVITPSVDLPAYYKGFFAWDGSKWAQVMRLASTESYRYEYQSETNPNPDAWVNQGPTAQPSCPNEDVNRNGVREAAAYVSGGTAPALASRREDLNWNGELDPRKADVAIKMVGSSKTDSSGLAIVQIEYGKDLASWVDFVITVTASGISGTESRARYVGTFYGNGNLPYPASAVSNENTSPAFVVSPYGSGTVCTDGN